MQHLTFKRKAQLFTILTAITLTMGCVKSGYNEAVVYNNNFKTGVTDKLTGAILYKNNGEYLIGRYNKGGFTIDLENLPTHQAIEIIAEPRFHDSWDGNNNYGGIDGPDIWNINMDGTTVLNATFSNTPCNAIYCLYQSYPAEYGMINNPPKTGAYLDIAGICHMTDVFKTSVYKINKTIKHSASKVRINFRDLLVQKNVADQMCEYSVLPMLYFS
ncbi:MAG: hypothetical protein LW602_08245 [Sediminibacterium sp.]|nr:hypothetical protein [Sediminibacterium sp.]